MKTMPKIIITDDTPVMRRLLKNSLIKAGLSEISEAGNGAELLQRLGESHFDLIICDWDMPIMSGLEALRRIRESDTHQKNIPFVMVTAVSDAEHVKEAIEFGIHDYIAKPIQPDVFINKVKKILANLNIAQAASA